MFSNFHKTATVTPEQEHNFFAIFGQQLSQYWGDDYPYYHGFYIGLFYNKFVTPYQRKGESEKQTIIRLYTKEAWTLICELVEASYCEPSDD